MLGCDEGKKIVKEYRLGGDFIYTAPKEEESFFLVPYQYYGDTSTPFIEIYKGDKLARTVNCAYIAEVRFDTNN